MNRDSIQCDLVQTQHVTIRHVWCNECVAWDKLCHLCNNDIFSKVHIISCCAVPNTPFKLIAFLDVCVCVCASACVWLTCARLAGRARHRPLPEMKIRLSPQPPPLRPWHILWPYGNHGALHQPWFTGPKPVSANNQSCLYLYTWACPVVGNTMPSCTFTWRALLHANVHTIRDCMRGVTIALVKTCRHTRAAPVLLYAVLSVCRVKRAHSSLACDEIQVVSANHDISLKLVVCCTMWVQPAALYHTPGRHPLPLRNVCVPSISMMTWLAYFMCIALARPLCHCANCAVCHVKGARCHPDMRSLTGVLLRCLWSTAETLSNIRSP